MCAFEELTNDDNMKSKIGIIYNVIKVGIGASNVVKQCVNHLLVNLSRLFANIDKSECKFTIEILKAHINNHIRIFKW